MIVRAESARDHADCYMSLRHMPPVYVSDIPCTIRSHMEIRFPKKCEEIFGSLRGCFERPNSTGDPQIFTANELLPPNFLEENPHLTISDDKFVHPYTGKRNRYLVGDRFHNVASPHTHNTCRYHDINNCSSLHSYATSLAEVDNAKTKDKRLSSACSQNPNHHAFYNMLMDYDNNMGIVCKQKKEIQKRYPDHLIVRDRFLRFVLSDKIC
ncbi:unnamed protein product [Owenia fusiformis]|uniref:Uncharacterized protein n=1 Tax=Owenia fusiformis TaxID=6347 RepID=A0A8S4Q904_OWEFU|nr:unnamed protein product [Owenia fusiformis]